MTVKEMIEALAGKNPEAEVMLVDWGDHNMYNKVKEVKTTKAKEHYHGFFETSKLKTGGWLGGEAFKMPYQRQIFSRPDIKVVVIR